MRECASLGNHETFRYGSADSTLNVEAQWGLEAIRRIKGFFSVFHRNLDFILLAWEATQEFERKQNIIGYTQ